MAKFTPVEGNPFEARPVEQQQAEPQQPAQQQLGEATSVTGGQFVGGGVVPPTESETAKDLIKTYTGVDKEKGVDNLAFRAAFSRTDTSEEKAQFLNDKVGQGNWQIDRSGDYIINPQGLSNIGIQSDLSRPVDESGYATADLVDFAGDAPTMLGAIGGSLAATGAGLPEGLLLAGAGAAVGKGVDEAIEYFQGNNTQSGEDVLKDVGKEALLGAVGEGVFRGASAIGRKVLSPSGGKIPAEELALAKEADKLDVSLFPSQVTNNKLLARFQGLVDNVLGSKAVVENAKALDKAITNIGIPAASKEEAGKAITGNIFAARQSLRDWSNTAYTKVDELTGGQGFIPTRKFKESVQKQLDTMTDPTTGEVIPAFAKDFEAMSKIADLPEFVTVGQMQKVSNGIDMASDSLTRTIDDATAASFMKGVNASYDDAANFEGHDVAKKLLGEVRTQYAKEIQKFDDAVIKSITKDPKRALNMEPSKVIKTIFKPDSPELLNRVLKFADKETKLKLQGAAMKQFIDAYKPVTKDPFELVFNGAALKKQLNKFGDDTMHAMFGKDVTQQLHTLADVTRLASRGSGGSGGIVAANIALSPLANIGVLAKLNILNKLLRTKRAMKWLTEGIAAPKTRVGSAALTRLGAYTATLAESEKASFKERLLAKEQQ